MITKELQRMSLHLKPLDKIRLIEMVMESPDKPAPEIEKAWVAESEVRYAKYKTYNKQTGN